MYIIIYYSTLNISDNPEALKARFLPSDGGLGKPGGANLHSTAASVPEIITTVPVIHMNTTHGEGI